MRRMGARCVVVLLLALLGVWLPGCDATLEELSSKAGLLQVETSSESADSKGADESRAQPGARGNSATSNGMETDPGPSSSGDSQAIDENGTYTSRDDVALYLHTYGHLPSNYITKDEAEDAGWKTEGLDLDEACPGKSIGGDRFGNREGRLPKARGRTWYECDIDYRRGNRNAKRLVYSNDGLIYYTEDHYKTFKQLY